jgi:hypothetical protein
MNGSAAFSNATAIAVAGGAIFNVTGRSDGTLTLNSNQTLKGNGTVSGVVVSGNGSTINPGFPMGTLTVSGNVTMNSASKYMANLDRTNALSNSSILSSGGTITYAGTLIATNVGPGLVQGDKFQLFSSAVTTFSAFVLQTNDVVNNLKYSWTNNVAVDGSISVGPVSILVATNPIPIMFMNNGGTSLTLAWPADHTGWQLQSQTNRAGLGTNWSVVAGSTVTNMVVVPIVRTNTCVFYRLVH